MKEKPDEILLEKIVSIFRRKQLIPESKLERFKELFAGGNMTSEKWIILAGKEGSPDDKKD